MSPRARSLAFGLAALLAAALAAGIADGYGASVVRGYGSLRPVVVAAEDLSPGRALGPRRVATALDVRRVPLRFVPPGALADPAEALGLVPVAPAPAGSYLLAAQLRQPRARRRTDFSRNRHPVEIAVSGARALLAAGAAPAGTKVDVVVTAEPRGSGPGRTYVAAAGVPLLALGAGPAGLDPGGTSAATLALTKRQALRLIAAESFARKLTLLPEG